MTTFGQRLRDARKQARLSQKEVAKRVGMSQSLLSELENDEYPTSGFTLKLAHLYKVSARWLAEGKGSRELPSVEMLDDPAVSKLWAGYQGADDAGRALVDFLLRGENDARPEWMSTTLAATIENTRQLVREQIEAAK